METLPPEIRDKIFNEIFCENPRGLYGFRRISKTWKDMIDQCTARLLKFWCKKCADEIPKNILDDFIQMRLSQSWQKYFSYHLSMPHIARSIYKSLNEFPSLNGRPDFTEICPSLENERKSISSYAVNDKYFAISFSVKSGKETKGVLRIYSLDDLTYCLKEYPIDCMKMDFYATDNREFIVFCKKDKLAGCNITSFLIEFLVNGNLIPANLPVNDDYIRYVITKNECFSFKRGSYGFQHQRVTQNGFQSSTEVQLPFPNGTDTMQVTNIQICHSNLFVFVNCRKKNSRHVMVVFRYLISRQLNGKLSFVDVIIYQKKSSADGMRITFDSDNIPLQNTICDVYPLKLSKWMKNFFSGLRQIYLVNIYAQHVLILFDDKLIVFRGTFQQFMDYAVKNANPESVCTVIKLNSLNLLSFVPDYARVIEVESKPQFLVITSVKAFIVKFIP